MAKIELLAPAGSKEAFFAAIAAGADAIYLGGKQFNARMYSENMTDEELATLISYAHVRGVKVYITLNTIIFESELDQLASYLETLYKIGADALIVQDFGVIEYVRKTYPDFPLHASTQMNIHSKTGVSLLKKLGFERIVLAREVSLKEVKEFVKLGIELEVFAHGALCFSYSGNCYLSSSIGNRSGNRGQCAQPCRRQYQLVKDKQEIGDFQALISMKDLKTIEEIPSLIEAGITSLKIEGRMKKPEYVYTVVSAYRKAIDEYYNKKAVVITPETIQNLVGAFNRGFTKGYLFEERNDLITNVSGVNHQGLWIGKVKNATKRSLDIELKASLHLHDGIRIIDKNEFGFLVTNLSVNQKQVKEANANQIVTIHIDNEVKVGANVYKTTDVMLSESLKDAKREPLHILGFFRIAYQEPLQLFITDGVHEVKVQGEIVSQLANRPLDVERIEEQLKKTGVTPYVFRNIKIDIDPNYFVSIKAINEIRRLALEELSNKREGMVSRNKYQSTQGVRSGEIIASDGLEVIVSNTEQREECLKQGISLIYDEEGNEKLEGKTKIIPNLSRIESSPRQYHDFALINDLGALLQVKNPISSFYLNVANHYSLIFLQRFGVKISYLSVELSLERLKDLLNQNKTDIELGVLVYGRYDAMITAHCPISKALGFTHKHCQKGCRYRYALNDQFGYQHPIMTDDDCIVRILNHKILNLIEYVHTLKELGVKHFLLLFTNESREEVAMIIQAFKLALIGSKTTLRLENQTQGAFKTPIL